MLPTGHIEFTLASLHLLQTRSRIFRQADFRWIALAAVAPDLLDKPLALTAYRDTQAALFWGHNLWFHLGVWGAILAWTVARGTKMDVEQGIAGLREATPGAGAGKSPEPGAAQPADSPRPIMIALPFLLAFSGHLVADRMWGFRETLFYPLGAGHWHPWVHVGEPQAMLGAYIDIIRTTPILLAFEVVGAALLAWVAWERGWARRVRAAVERLHLVEVRSVPPRPVDDEA